jgi:hypothetical protein
MEWFNHTLLNMLATIMGDHPRTWEEYLPSVLYNTSVG